MALERPTASDFAARIKIFAQPLRRIYSRLRVRGAVCTRGSTVQIRQSRMRALLVAVGLSALLDGDVSRQPSSARMHAPA